METIIYGLCAAVVLMWLANAIRFYQNQYKHKFYKHIYSNFFEYYYKFSVKHDASVSSYIKNRIGANRIVFNSYLNEKYVPVHELVTIITTKGVLVCYIINSIGEVSGKDSDKHLIVKHDNKRFKIKVLKKQLINILRPLLINVVNCLLKCVISLRRALILVVLRLMLKEPTIKMRLRC